MPLQDIAAKVVRGFAGAAGNQQAEQDVEGFQQKREDDKANKIRMQIAPLALAAQGIQSQLPALIDPATGKPRPESQARYDELHDQLSDIIHKQRMILLPPPKEDPHGLGHLMHTATDKLHITRNAVAQAKAANQKKIGDYNKESDAQVKETMQGVVPEANPYQQERRNLEGAGFSSEDVQKGLEHKAGILPKLTSDGIPYKGTDGKWYQNFKDASGQITPREMPPGYSGPSSKSVKGTLVRSKQSPTGFAQTYIDPYNPGKVLAWQPVTPSRYYQGTKTDTTDAFGVTTHAVTQPLNQQEVDLSTAAQMPTESGGEDVAPSGNNGAPAITPSPIVQGPKTKQLRHIRQQAATAAGGGKLDEQGHIPADAGNPYLVQAANSILDGMDVEKLPIPQKDRTAAMQLAQKFGWKGQGLFNPREVLQLKEGATVIQKMIDSDALSVLDQGTIKQLPMLGQGADPSKEGFFGRLGQNWHPLMRTLSSRNLCVCGGSWTLLLLVFAH